MKNFVQEGEEVTFKNTAGDGSVVLAGTVVVVGDIVAILRNDCADGDTQPAQCCGVFEVTKVGNEAVAIGDKAFWDKVAKQFTKTPSANADLLAGVFYTATGAGAGETTGQVLLICGIGVKGAAVADEATVNGNDAGTTQTLANALKVKINALLASLRAAGIIDQ